MMKFEIFGVFFSMNITFECFFSRKVETKPGDFDVEIMKIEPITSNFVQTQLQFYFNKKKTFRKIEYAK